MKYNMIILFFVNASVTMSQSFEQRLYGSVLRSTNQLKDSLVVIDGRNPAGISTQQLSIKSSFHRFYNLPEILNTHIQVQRNLDNTAISVLASRFGVSDFYFNELNVGMAFKSRNASLGFRCKYVSSKQGDLPIKRTLDFDVGIVYSPFQKFYFQTVITSITSPIGNFKRAIQLPFYVVQNLIFAVSDSLLLQVELIKPAYLQTRLETALAWQIRPNVAVELGLDPVEFQFHSGVRFNKNKFQIIYLFGSNSFMGGVHLWELNYTI